MSNQNDPNRSFEESYDQRQDFDDGANDLWTVYGKEAKSHDQIRINVLKDDMEGILLFVCACFCWFARVDVTLALGWFILCCSRRVHRAKDEEFECDPRKPVGLLPESIRSDA